MIFRIERADITDRLSKWLWGRPGDFRNHRDHLLRRPPDARRRLLK